ncbi:MAG TPA: glycosyltransferase family 4 protein [Planctomycetota bacterium]
MRLVVLLDRWRSGNGGLEAYLERVLPALAVRHQVWLVARDADVRPPAGVRSLAARTRAPRPRPWRDFADAHAQARAVATLQADCVLSLRAVPCGGAVWQPHGGSAPDLQRARGLGPPTWRTRRLHALETETLTAASGVLAMSPKVARELAARRPGLPAMVLPPPLPAAGVVRSASAAPAAARAAARAETAPRLIFCGRDARLKGADRALAWFRALRVAFPQATLDLWSRDLPHLQRVLGAAPDALARQGVMLHGWDGAFRAALGDAALLLHPTRYDACSLVALEAAAAGVPVLTTPDNGLSELLGAPLLNVVTAPDDAQIAARLAEKILSGLADRAAERGQAAEAVRADFALDRHVAALERALTAGPEAWR